MLKNSKGFGVVEVILIIVIIGVAGYIGYIAFQGINKSSSTPQTQSTPTPKEEEKVAEEPKSTTKYLKVSQWNVQLPLEQTVIADASYSTGRTSTPGVEVKDITTSKIKNAKCENNDTMIGTVGALYRSKSKESLATATNTTVASLSSVAIGDYHYTYWGGSGYGNCKVSAETLQLLQSTQTALADALKGLKAY